MWATISLILLTSVALNFVLPPNSHQPSENQCTRKLINIMSFFKRPLLSNHIRKADKSTLVYLTLVLLMNASDIELNPGPVDKTQQSDYSTAYLCGSCKQPVSWDDKGIMCEACFQWYHIHCQGRHDSSYSQLGSSDVAWTCLTCDGPNYSSILFDLHGVASENRYHSLIDSSIMSIDSLNSQDLAEPRFTSSPEKPKPKPACNSRPLRILNINCQSLVNKKGPFYNLIDSTKPDVIIATETWFNSNIGDAEYFSSQYYVHRRDRGAENPGGGVLIAVNSMYLSSREELLETGAAETLWCKLNIKGCKTLYIGACYRPKINDTETLEALETALSRLSGKDSIILLGGDFNLPGWDWQNRTLKPKAPYPSIHNKFGDILNDHGLTQIIEEPTRADNTLDLIITNRPNQINRTQILPGISDHNVVYTELEVKPVRKKQVPRSIPLYNKANWPAFREHVTQLATRIREIELASSVEELWCTFRDSMHKGIQTFIPSKTTKSRDSCPWLDDDLKRKIRRRDRAHKSSRRTGRAEAEKRFLKLKQEVQRDQRRAYWKYVESIITPQDSDTNEYSGMKRFWKFIKHRRTDHNGVAPLKVDGKLVTDAKPKAEALNRQFQSVFTVENDFNASPPAHTVPPMQDITITTNGVLKLLQNLNPGKACGPDNISPRVLKELADIIADPLTRIFQKSLNEQQVPKDWRHATVTPVFKKGQKYDCANYRPISLTCIASKLMEHIICSNIMKHAKDNDILYPLQHGFREERSCETQLLEFVHDVAGNMQQGLQTDVCVLDFSKAFDKVGHQRLIEKLNWYGIGGKTNGWIKSFLSDRTQAVVVDGESSNSVPVMSGVPQGSVLGPCLFLFYINDITDGLTSTARLFADDTMIYMTIKNEMDAQDLQRDLDLLTVWEKKWMMEFHPAKCEVITISRKKSPIMHTYTLHGHALKHVDHIKYLGLTISSDLRWDRHVDNITSKATNTLNFLRRNINVGNPQVKEQAYKSLVRPSLEYSQAVWDPHTAGLIKKVEKVQRQAARFTLHRYRRTSSVGAMLTQLEWPSLEERRRQARLVMFYKIHYQLVAINMPLVLKGHQHETRTENTLAYCIPFCASDYMRQSFFIRTARDWNTLPQHIVTLSTPVSFRGAICQM